MCQYTLFIINRSLVPAMVDQAELLKTHLFRPLFCSGPLMLIVIKLNHFPCSMAACGNKDTGIANHRGVQSILSIKTVGVFQAVNAKQYLQRLDALELAKNLGPLAPAVGTDCDL
jgi:hypothetical protein